MEQIDYDVDDFICYCEAKNLSKKTYGSYEQTLRLLVQYLKNTYSITETKQIRERHIREYVAYLQERGKYSVVADERTKATNFPENRQDYGKRVEITTINNYIRNIKVFFNYMYESRYITENPIRRIKEIKNQRKVDGYLNDNDMNKLFKTFDLSKFHEYRDYIVSKLIFDTGMRITETLLIEETDIDFTKRSILLIAENTKEKKDRYVFFSAEMAKELKKWLQYKDRYRQSDYVFCTHKGKLLNANNFEKNFKKYGESLGLKDIHPHMLRNNFAKRFLMSGGDIYTLSRILGHSSVKVTEEAYLDLDTDDLRINYQRYSPLANLNRA